MVFLGGITGKFCKVGQLAICVMNRGDDDTCLKAAAILPDAPSLHLKSAFSRLTQYQRRHIRLLIFQGVKPGRSAHRLFRRLRSP